MASIAPHPKSRIWHIQFIYAGKAFHKSLKTKKEKDAEALAGRIESRLHHLNTGTLHLPAEADLWQWLLSDGHREKKPEPPEKAWTLKNLFDWYFANQTENAKESNTLGTEKIHRKHLLRVLGDATLLATITVAELQGYVNQRTKEKYRGKVMVRLRRRHPLPEDKEVFILDATADENLIRAVAVGWDVRVWSCPELAQEGEVIQIMDYDTSRNFIKKEVKRHREHAPCWTAQVIDAILSKTDSAAFISFKRVATDRLPGFDILSLLQIGHKIKERHHFPCRGISVSSDVLIVLGTPYKDDVTVRELALSIYGVAGCPAGDYRRRFRQEGCFVAGNMGYGEPRMDLSCLSPIWKIAPSGLA